MKGKTLDDFKKSLRETAPANDLSVHEKALWCAGKGNWDKAHDLIQDIHDKAASRIHAYLHRFEGDLSNAHYWYAKADAKMPDMNLEQEWEALVKEYL
jgi:TolA-binding protein